MTVTAEAFVLARPEFVRAPAESLASALAEAVLEVDAEVWGDLTDIGVSLLAAHKLAISPFGQMAKLVAKDGSTTYGVQFHLKEAQVSCGLRFG